MKASDAEISIVVPLYNEEAVIRRFHARLTATLDGLDLQAEVVYVNDAAAIAASSFCARFSAPRCDTRPQPELR